ncbi:hypothetical protein [Bacillus mycoides]|uniref:hypothetical protein n=1 Tax=Bacillus mycoides TaxID=1405 RepID=UPI003A810BFB
MTMKNFGIVAGIQSEAIAGQISSMYPEVEFTKAWGDLRELKNDVTRGDREVLGDIEGILILDWGLPSDDTEEEFSHIVFMQDMFRAKKFFGMYLFFCTKRVDLYKRLDQHFMEMPDAKYEGTKVDLVHGYEIDMLYKLLSFPYAVLQKGAKELDIRRDEQRKAAQALRDSRRFWTLMGRKEEIQAQQRRLDAEERVIDKELLNFTQERIERNLDMAVNDLESAPKKIPGTTLLEPEEIEAKVKEEIEPKKKKKGLFF